MRYPTEAVAAQLLLRMSDPEHEDVPRYTVRAPDGRRFDGLDLPGLIRLFQQERVDAQWQIAPV
ncbi:MAG: hypothetical protein ACODAU_11280 [Myxococcota bacterium]